MWSSEQDALYFVLAVACECTRTLGVSKRQFVSAMGSDNIKQLYEGADVWHQIDLTYVSSELTECWGVEFPTGDFVGQPVGDSLGIAGSYFLLVNQLGADPIDSLISVFNNPFCDIFDLAHLALYQLPQVQLVRMFQTENNMHDMFGDYGYGFYTTRLQKDTTGLQVKLFEGMTREWAVTVKEFRETGKCAQYSDYDAVGGPAITGAIWTMAQLYFIGRIDVDMFLKSAQKATVTPSMCLRTDGARNAWRPRYEE